MPGSQTTSEITIIYENLRKMGQFSNLQKILYENLRKIEAKIFTLRTVRTKNRTLRNSQSPCYENLILYTWLSEYAILAGGWMQVAKAIDAI